LFGCLGVDEACNAGRYSQLANRSIDSLLSAGKLPIVVGGSGLYLKSLTHGLSDLPTASPELRAELETLSDEALVTKLRSLDPVGAEQTNLQNRRYVSRAIEISLLAGRPMSELKNEWAQQDPPEFDGIVLERPREELYARINARVPKMVAVGMLDEISNLPEVLSNTAEKAIGVREVRAHLTGELTLDECVSAIQQASRRYAKRQLTWFRRETGFQRVCLAANETAESAAERALVLFPHLNHA
jgi:tRNA dimethylallyltransferase